MSNFNRRQFLKGILGTLAQAAGTVVLASTAAAQARQQTEAEPKKPASDGLSTRADQLAAEAESSAPEAAPAEFLNGFRNLPGWHNGWPNGGFRNMPGWNNGIGWPNGGWRNGVGWGNGGFRNGGFRNGNTWLNW